MAESLGTIYYDVDANLDPLLGKMRQAESALGGLDSEMKKTDQGAAQMQKSFDKTERSAASLGGQLNGLTRVIKGVVAAMAIREMAGMVQQYQAMAERVEMATRSADEFEMVQRRLQSTADGTYRSLSEAQELFIRTADSIRDMGYSLDQAIDIQDSMSYAFVTNATSADRAQAAISQFTKAVNTGKVSADQWETISSAIPTIMNDIAEATGRSASEVRALGAAGKLAARDLTEGLRKSLDDTRTAADGMATDLIDAGVRVRNALTTVLVALEEQTGGIQMVTDGIIAASEALLEFGQDAEKMESFLNLATTAAASLAAVMAGRLLTSLGGATAALYQNTIAARAKAAAELQAAQTAAALAAQNLIQAQAAERAAVGLSTHAAAARSLTAAQAQATAATATLAAAQRTMATNFSVATAAANGLRTAMAFLGGPSGVILLAAAAVWTWHSRVQTARNSTLELSSSVRGLTAEMRELEKIENAKRIDDETQSLERQNRALRNNASLRPHADRGEAATRAFEEEMLRRRVAIQKTEERIEALQKRQQQLANANIPAPRRTGGTTEPTLTGGTPKELTEFQKLEQSLKNQAALAKLAGLARAELAALQRLGADATEEERARIKELVGEIYRLEEAQESAQQAEQERLRTSEEARKTSEEARKAAEDNADTIAGLEEQMRQAEMTAGELAARQAELSLNEYATPEQIRRVKELGDAMRENAELERMEQMEKDAIAADPRTAAENQYEQQLEAYRAYKEAELITDQQYNELKNAASTQYEQQRLAAQEEIFRAQSRGNEFVMSSVDALGHASTDVISGILSGTMNTQKAMQALGQAIFREAVGAIVQMGVQYVKSLIMGQTAQAAAAAAAVATGATVAAAWAPAAAMVSLATLGTNAAPATAGITTTVGVAQGMSLAGGRLVGGPVNAGSMYRVNENGAPEVFSAANGQQFMIPNQRGEVISNRDATAGGVAAPIINVYNAENTRSQVTTTKNDQGQDVIDIVVQNLLGDGEIASAVGRITGTDYRGS